MSQSSIFTHVSMISWVEPELVKMKIEYLDQGQKCTLLLKFEPNFLILIKENPCLTSPKDPAPSLEMTWKHWLKYRSLLCSL